MSERTDRQLVEIVTIKRSEYQPEAILAAEKEIENRQINLDAFTATEKVNFSESTVPPDKMEKGFEWYHKALTVFLPATVIAVVSTIFNHFGATPILRVIGFPTIVLIHYAIHRRLKDLGYTKMAGDFMHWVTYSLYIYIGLLLILGLAIFFFAM